MITGSVMDVHRISIGAPIRDEWTPALRPRTRRRAGRGGRGGGGGAVGRLTIAPSSLRCVSVCCTRNGRHVLAVTRARGQTHAHVNNKDSVDVTGLVRDRFVKWSECILGRHKNKPCPCVFVCMRVWSPDTCVSCVLFLKKQLESHTHTHTHIHRALQKMCVFNERRGCPSLCFTTGWGDNIRL